MINLVKAETKRYFIEIKTYYPDQIVDVIVKYLLFTLFFYGFTQNATSVSYIGYLYWIVASCIISELSVNVSYEKQTGTFEQLILKPYPCWLIMIVRTYIVLLVTLAKSAALVLVIGITLPVSFSFSLSLLPVFLVSIIGYTGLGLLLSGLTLKFTKIASFEAIISYGLLLLSGFLIPYASMPHGIRILLSFLPFSAGIEVSQRVLANAPNGFGLQLLWLFLLNSLGFLFGLFVFRQLFRHVRKYGLLNRY